MAPPTRSEFVRSTFYLCAVAYDRRNEERLNNIRDLLNQVDDTKKRNSAKAPRKKGAGHGVWKLPDFDGTKSVAHRNSHDDKAIIDADKDKENWIYNPESKEYDLRLGGILTAKLPSDMYQYLKPFQRDAVKWIAGVLPIGCILADDMGMGKTCCAIATIGAKMRVKRVRMALVVAPVSVLAVWQTEGKRFLSKFVKGVRIIKVHGGNQKTRNKSIRNAWKDSSPDSPYVIVSSWGLVTSKRNYATFKPPSGHRWDFVVLDEAHEIRVSKAGNCTDFRLPFFGQHSDLLVPLLSIITESQFRPLEALRRGLPQTWHTTSFVDRYTISKQHRRAVEYHSHGHSRPDPW